MFTKSDEGGYAEVLDGVRLQTGYLVSGRLDFVIGDDRFDAGPGDSWNIAGDVPHGATALEDSIVIEIFAPVREDYLQYGPERS